MTRQAPHPPLQDRTLAARLIAITSVVSVISGTALLFPQIASAEEVPAPPETSFTFAVVPDTQNEVMVDGTPQLTSRYQWLSDNRSALNLKFVAQTGDLVNWGVADPAQFRRASEATTVLDASGIPYSYAIGNHDGAAVKVGGSAAPGNVRDNLRDTALFNQTFPLSRFTGVEGTFEPNKVDNMYQTFRSGGVDWLVLTHEMWPRESVIQWMSGVVASHPTFNVIVSTHAFTDQSGMLPTTGTYGDQNALVEWNEFTSQYPNIKIVISGHYGASTEPVINGGYSYTERTGVNGNKVALVMTAYHSTFQNHVRLLNIDTAAGTINSSVYVSRSTSALYPTGYVVDGASNFVATGMNWIQPDGTSPATPPTVAPAPTAVTAIAGNGQASVGFSPPISNGGSPITGYTVTSSPGGIVSTGSSPPIVVGGLVNGRSYSFTVRAVNAVGIGASSSPSSVVTPMAPAVSTELLSDPGFENGVSGWKAFNVGTLTSVSSPVHSGAKSLRVAAVSTAANLVGLTQNSVISNSVSGRQYTAQCWAYPTSSGLNSQIRLLQYTQDFGSNTRLNTTVIGSLPANAWTLVKVTGTATQNGMRVIPQIYSTNQTTATGSVIYDDCSVTVLTPVAASPPGSPSAVSAIAGDGSVRVTFDAPATDGGSAVTSYTVTSNPGNVTVTGPGSPITVGGLVNGTAYTFTVQATNAAGTGVASATTSPVSPTAPITVPAPPTAVTATAGDGSATVSFAAPLSDGGSAITGYTVTSSPGNLTASSAGSPITIGALTNGVAYTFTVSARNAIGEGQRSAASGPVVPAAPATVPSAPATVVAVAGDMQATVSFTAPVTDGGSPIRGYTVTSSPGNVTVTGASSPIVVAGLRNGIDYTFTVSASNTVGTGAASDPSPPVTPTVVLTPPAAPSGIVAVAGNGQATVSFSPPTNDGGAPITGYTVTSTTGSFAASGAGSPITVTGLANGTAYVFTVSASNAIGSSAPSVSSTAVTPVAPATAPEAPRGVTAVAGNARATVSFSAPASDGGSPVTAYVVKSVPGGIVASGAASPIIVSGLANGTSYSFTVQAVNAVGAGSASVASGVVVPVAPAVSTELLSDPGFENGVSGWKAFNVGTLTSVSSPAHSGAKSLRVAAVSTAVDLVGLTQNSVIPSSVAGRQYTAQCWAYASTAGLNVQLRFLQYTQNFASNIKLNTTTVSRLPVNVWTLVKVTGTATQSGYRVIPQIYSTNQTTNTGTVTYDDCSVSYLP